MAAYWPTGESDPDATEPTREFARSWNAIQKVVFSTELESVGHGARLVRGDYCLDKRLQTTSGRSHPC